MRKYAISLLFLLSSQLLSFADEGMWILPNIPDSVSESFEELGCELEIKDIYHERTYSLKDQTAYLSNGYTATLLSESGLLITNYNAITKYISEKDSNIILNGFYASEKYNEIPLGNLHVFFLKSTENVTWRISSKFLDSDNESVRKNKTDSISRLICNEKVLPAGCFAQVKKTSNEEYYLYIYERYSDLRLSYIPPKYIAEYGNKKDKWTASRHNADFALIRIYAARDGQPAYYSDTNKHAEFSGCAKIAVEPYKEDDFVFALGYPNNSERNIRAADIYERIMIKNRISKQIMSRLQDMRYRDYQDEIDYITRLEAYIDKQNIIKKKQSKEYSFIKWAANNANFNIALRYSNVIPHLNSYYKKRESAYSQLLYLKEFSNRIDLLMVGNMMIELNDNNQDDIFYEISRFYERYNTAIEKQVLLAALNTWKEKCDSAYLPDIFNVIQEKHKGDIGKYLDELFKKSFITEEMRFNKYIDRPTEKQFESDMLIILCKSVLNAQLQAYSAYMLDNDKIERCNRLYKEGVNIQHPSDMAMPDANYTLRMSVGKIASYSPSDGFTINYATTFNGLFEKSYTYQYEDKIDYKLKALRNKGKGLRLNFMTTCDMPPLNTGEGVYNANGDLLGVLSSGNSETICSEYSYNEQYQRTTALDINYVIFLLKEYSKANKLIEELHFREAEKYVNIEYIEDAKKPEPAETIVYTSEDKKATGLDNVEEKTKPDKNNESTESEN